MNINPNSPEELQKRIEKAQFSVNYNADKLDNARITFQFNPSEYNQSQINYYAVALAEKINLYNVLIQRQNPEPPQIETSQSVLRFVI